MKIKCPSCGKLARINKKKQLAWHRLGHPKWCPQSKHRAAQNSAKGR